MTSNSPVVSIIVPVYNSEPYLEECLLSIVNQTCRSIEIILVNDGSTDRSFEIMESYSIRDDRIVLLSQSNRGASAARNAGLKVAKGEYILFVDSDDTIRNDTVETFYRQALSTNPEIVIGNVYYCHPDGKQSAFFERLADYAKQPSLSGEQCFTKLMEANLFPTLVVLYFTKRAFIQQRQLFFEEGIVHEDELWCAKALIYAPKVSFVDLFHYFYRLRQGSVMLSDNKKLRVSSLFRVSKELEEFVNGLEEKQEFVNAAGYVYIRIFYLYYSICRLLKEMEEDTDEYKKYFEQLLKKIYPALSRFQKQACFNFFHGGNKLLVNGQWSMNNEQ